MTEPTPRATPAFTMLGGDDALACVDEACLIPAVADVGTQAGGDPGSRESLDDF